MRSEEIIKVEKKLNDLFVSLQELSEITNDVTHANYAHGVKLAGQALGIVLPLKEKQQYE